MKQLDNEFEKSMLLKLYASPLTLITKGVTKQIHI